MLSSRVCTLLMVVAAVVLTSLASSFQEQEQTPQAPPRFRTEVAAVLVDVLVLDEQGRPMAGLRREDFRVLEDGALQEIDNFDIIDWSSYVGRAAPQGEPTTPEPGAVVNAFPRRFIFIINRQNARTRFIRRAKLAMENFVVESMTDGDEALVLDMGLSTKVLQQFKDSKEETLQTIRKISLLEADLYRGTGSDLGTRNVYDTLESLGQGLGQFPGRKIVIFMSPELGRTQNLITYLEDTVDAFNQSNTTIYSIDINGVRGFGPAGSATPISSADAFSMGGLFPLANETGGRYYYNLNTFEPVLRKIGIENSRYYQLLYTSTNTNYDGKYRSIQVKVDRPNAEVVARRGYFAKKAPAPVDAEAVPEKPTPPPARASATEPTPAPTPEPSKEISELPHGPAPPQQVEITTYLFPAGDLVEVPITVALPLDMLTSEDGVATRTLKLTITDEARTVAEFTDEVDPRNFFVVQRPRLAPGLYLLQLTVEASGKQVYQASTAIEVPEGFGKRFGFSSIVPVFPPKAGASGDAQSVEIRPTPNLNRGEDAFLFFRVFPGEGATAAEDDTKLTYVISQGDRELSSGRHASSLQLSGFGDAGFPVLLRLPTSDLPRGSYRVVLRVASPSLGRRAATEIELTID